MRLRQQNPGENFTRAGRAKYGFQYRACPIIRSLPLALPPSVNVTSFVSLFPGKAVSRPSAPCSRRISPFPPARGRLTSTPPPVPGSIAREQQPKRLLQTRLTDSSAPNPENVARAGA